MNTIDGTEQRRAFAVWLRTGRLPMVSDDGVELKFNPWHDPDDGKFTNAGAGRYFGPGGVRSADRRDNRKRNVATGRSRKVPTRGPIKKVAEFVDGVRQGVFDVGKETVVGLYNVATTDPRTTVRNFGEGVTKSIDAAIAAEDTPAREQARRAALAVANASAHDLGYATGRIGANTAIVAAPGAAATKVSAVRMLRAARPRETFHPPKTTWRKETISKEGPAKTYNDSATGARPGQAPALMRTMPTACKGR